MIYKVNVYIGSTKFMNLKACLEFCELAVRIIHNSGFSFVSKIVMEHIKEKF